MPYSCVVLMMILWLWMAFKSAAVSVLQINRWGHHSYWLKHRVRRFHLVFIWCFKQFPTPIQNVFRCKSCRQPNKKHITKCEVDWRSGKINNLIRDNLHLYSHFLLFFAVHSAYMRLEIHWSWQLFDKNFIP